MHICLPNSSWANLRAKKITHARGWLNHLRYIGTIVLNHLRYIGTIGLNHLIFTICGSTTSSFYWKPIFFFLPVFFISIDSNMLKSLDLVQRIENPNKTLYIIQILQRQQTLKKFCIKQKLSSCGVAEWFRKCFQAIIWDKDWLVYYS